MKKIFLTLILVLFVIPFGMSQELPSYVPTDGLVAYYPFNGNANDASGNGNHGTVIEATLTSDRDGNENSAYDFNGDNSIINLPELDSNIGTPGVITSYSMWFKGSAPQDSNGLGSGNIFHAFVPENGDYYIRFEVARSTENPNLFLKVYYRNPNDNNEPSKELIDYSTQTWHNITVVADGISGLYNYYFNGVNLPEMSFSFNPNNDYSNSNRVWQIGRINPAPNSLPHAFLGQIDDIGIWNRALTEQEIQNLYTSSTGDILLNGVVSAENNQIKNVNNPTDDQDVATKSYVDNNVNSFSGSYNDLTDTPTMYTQAQVDALISNLQSQIDGLTTPQGTAAINHNNKTYSGVSCEGFWLGFKFSVSDTQTITALGAWDEGHNIEVNDEFSSCPDASNFSVPIAIYKNDVLVLEKVINASNGVVIGNSRYIRIDDFVLIPGNEYFIIGNYEGSSKFGYFDSNLASSDYDSRITPLTVTSSSLFSKNTNGDGTFPSNLTTLSDNQWSDQYFHVNFLLKD